MKPQEKIFDTLQFIGLLLGLILSVILIFPAEQDPVASAILGLGVALFFQLYDLQRRQSASEERLLQATALSQTLYRDEWLYNHIKQIVDDYISVKDVWFDLFKIRADDAVTECRRVLHGMADGNLVVQRSSPYSSGAFTVPKARKSAKAVAAIDDSYWRTPEGETYVQENANAIRRGIRFIRVFIYPTATLRRLVDVLQNHQDLGIEVYVASAESLPKELNEDYLILDDRLLVRTEQPWELQRISIDKSEVEQAVKRFDTLLRHAKKLANVIDNLRLSD